MCGLVCPVPWLCSPDRDMVTTVVLVATAAGGERSPCLQSPGSGTGPGIWDRARGEGQDLGYGTEPGLWDRAQHQENSSTRWGFWTTSGKPRLTLLALSY